MMDVSKPADSRNIALLSVVQAMNGSNQSIVMTVGALTAVTMAPDPRLVTVPITAMIVGLALGTWPSTRIIYRLGRMRGFILGAALAVPASVIATVAVALKDFYLFSAALFLVGASAASLQQVRFAAADSVALELKNRAISWVMFGGVAAGFLGPQLSSLTRLWIGGAEYGASYLVIGLLAVISIVALSKTRLAAVPSPEDTRRAGRSIAVLLRTPAILVPIATAALAYALMTLIMVAAPLAMVHVCGHSPEVASGAIQWHVIAMFAPSFVTGSIIGIIGARATTALGLALIIASAMLALSGTDVANFVIGLVLLGLGWNLGFIGSTSLLTEAYAPAEAERAQALNEQIVFGTMAVASMGSGLLIQAIGWQAINITAIPAAVVGIAGVGLLGRAKRRIGQRQDADLQRWH
jgi:MFS family permease